MSSRNEPDRFHLVTDDGVRLDAAQLPAAHDSSTAIVMAHGFSGTWRHRRTRDIAAVFARHAHVITFDFRGHGHSRGVSTVGDLEVFDIRAAVAHARDCGFTKVAVVGFSMGASVAVRHAALYGGDVDAVVSVSGPAHWYYRGTKPMRRLHQAIELPVGRVVTRVALRTRVSADGWPTPPATPVELAEKIAPSPMLIVHGTQDAFFPLRHAYALYESAAEPKELWIENGMGHAESGSTPPLVERLGRWVKDAAASRTVLPPT